ncbi:methyltransferase family protein [Xanthomonas albilineans]|nr:isoprenylcysteine carboxylmethyltransferase family protein [Xanthomonas albilineans]
MALCGVIAWGLSRIDAWPASPPDAGSIGIVIVLAGVIFNVAPKRAFHRASTTVNPLQPQRATHLVQSGLYRWSRNPMYLGHALILLGLALCLRNVLALLAVPAYVTYFQIRPEERALQAHFGDAYTHYCRHVRRWL